MSSNEKINLNQSSAFIICRHQNSNNWRNLATALVDFFVFLPLIEELIDIKPMYFLLSSPIKAYVLQITTKVGLVDKQSLSISLLGQPGLIISLPLRAMASVLKLLTSLCLKTCSWWNFQYRILREAKLILLSECNPIESFISVIIII